MNISELIARLEELKREFGDLPVYHSGLDGSGMDEVIEASLDNRFGERNRTSGIPAVIDLA